MRKNWNVKQVLSRKKVQIGILIGVIAIVAFALALVTSHFRDHLGIDAISYMSIARQYANGHFVEAINAFWSPMISWLMAPLVKVGIGGALAFMIVNALTALFIIIFGAICIWRWTKGNFFAALVYVLAVSPLLIDVIRILSPDLLVVAWALIFLAVLSWAHKRLAIARSLDWRIVVALGAVGALGYVIKLYTLPVFTVSLLIWSVVLFSVYHPKARKDILRSIVKWLSLPILSIVCMFVIASPWIIALSLKYERVTMGSSFSVNVESKVDNEEGESAIKQDLEVPPNDYAVSFREDPTPQNNDSDKVDTQENTSASSSIKDRIQHYAGERLKAFPYYINKINTTWPFTLLILFVTLVAMLLGLLTYKKHTTIVLAWIVALVYFLGYAALVSVEFSGGNIRYYWPVFIFALVIACLALPEMWRRVAQMKQQLRTVLFVVFISLLPVVSFTSYIVGLQYVHGIPVRHSMRIAASERSQLVNVLLQGRDTPQIVQLADQIRADGVIPEGSRLVGDSYRMVVYLAYYLEGSAYGRSGETHANYYNLDDPEEALERHDIDYVITFTPAGKEARKTVSGEVVGEYNYTIDCQDERAGRHVPCDVKIIKLDK